MSKVAITQVRPSHYFGIAYDTKRRFCSYWHQIQESIALKPERMLEIGIGNSFVSRYLKERGLNIVTLDFNKQLIPDIAGSILNLPFVAESFDLVTCFQVIEHLPFNDLPQALSEMFRVSKVFALLSTIDRSRVLCCRLSVPLIGEIQRLIPLPNLVKPRHKFGRHYWEIGEDGYSLNRIKKEIKTTGFETVRTYRVFENPNHRFFILRKKR